MSDKYIFRIFKYIKHILEISDANIMYSDDILREVKQLKEDIEELKDIIKSKEL